MYGQTWYVHKDPQKETLRSQILINDYGKYTGIIIEKTTIASKRFDQIGGQFREG